MAAGQNNNRNPNNPNNRNNNNGRRPSNNRRKQKVPGAVIAIYIMMAVLVLAICALIFVITLKATGWNGGNPDDSSGVVLENSSDSLYISLSGSPADSSNNSDDSNHSDNPSDSGDSSSSESNWSVISVSSGSSESEGTLFSSSESSDSSETISSVSSSGTTPSLPVDFDRSTFENDLFIGDSIFTGLYLYGFLDAKNVAAAVGYTPYKAMYSTFNQSYSGSASDYAAEMKPKRIFIMLGSNTMAAGTNYDIIVSQYSTLLSSLKQNCPDSEICVISIPPVTSNSSAAANAKINNKDIDSVNVKLKNMASGAKVEYFDLNTMLSDDNGYFMAAYAEMDGLHFKGGTYAVLLSALQREVIKVADTIT